ncbi:CPBP family glutamic-type intramembrane protease [Paenibacillus puldeungensis]|uniref:CPBP family glutamic-type intramembrane protease n=1 Tax=Paenibacillus puldeungensis TaxID=696536 RepID=UPI0036D39240
MLGKKVVIFTIAAFGFTWLMWLPLLMNRQWELHLPFVPGQFYLGSFGPLFGAAVTAAVSGGREALVAWVKRAFSLRFGGKWLLIAIGLPILYGIIAVSTHALITGAWPNWSQFGLTEKLPKLNVWMTAVVWMLTFGIGEESGWRGYLLPELHKRYSLMYSSLIVALIWMLWHAPEFAFNPNYMAMGWGVIGWAISLSYGSVLLAWLCKGSGWSILPVVIWHGGFDLLTASDQAALVMAMVCSMLVIIHGIFLSKKMAQTTPEG